VKKIITSKNENPKRLLVVDDEINMQIMYKKVLSRIDIMVDTAGSFNEAVDKFTNRDYSLLLIDIRLKTSDGLELLQELRQAKPSVPAIMVTGYPSIYSASRSKELGAFDYLTKPIEINELNAAVDRALASVRI
jgi:DNA-binding NtrC family response regulator